MNKRWKIVKIGIWPNNYQIYNNNEILLIKWTVCRQIKLKLNSLSLLILTKTKQNKKKVNNKIILPLGI